jgi:hypothetical protein
VEEGEGKYIVLLTHFIIIIYTFLGVLDAEERIMSTAFVALLRIVSYYVQ